MPVRTANISFLCETNFSSAQSGYDIHWRKNDNLIPEQYNQARLHIRIATYDLDNTTFDCFIEYHGERNPQRVYSNEATLLVINGNYITDCSGHVKYYLLFQKHPAL